MIPHQTPSPHGLRAGVAPHRPLPPGARPARRRLRRPMSSGEILAATARAGGLDLGDLRGRRRTAPLVAWRFTAAWLLRRHTLLSLPQIGRLLDRDHSTIVHAVDAVDAARDRFAERIAAVEALL